MSCCCGERDPHEVPVIYDGAVSSMQSPVRVTPYSQRKCRDVLCLVIFIVFWIGMLMIAGIGFLLGDPNRIVYGLDGYGNTCGSLNYWNGTEGPDLTSKTKMYFLNPFDLINPSNILYGKKVCMESCPTSAVTCDMIDDFPCPSSEQYRCPYYRVAEDNIYQTLTGVEDWNTQYWGELASTNSSVCTLAESDSTALVLEQLLGGMDIAGSPSLTVQEVTAASGQSCGDIFQHNSALGQGPCYPVWVNTTDVFNRCIPVFDDKAIEVIDQATGGGFVDVIQAVYDATRIERYFVDLMRSWPIIVGVGITFAIFCAVVWLIWLRFFGGVMIWLTVVLVNVSLTACALCCFSLAGLLGKAGPPGQWLEGALPEALDPVDKDQQVWEILGWIVVSLEALVFIITIALATRIKLAVAVVKVAVEAIGTIPALVFFPFIPLLLESVLICAWLVVTAFLWASGEVVPVYNGNATSSMTSDQFLSLVIQTSGLNPTFGDASASLDSAVPSNQTLDDFNNGLPGDVSLTPSDGDCATDPTCRYELRWPKAMWYMAGYHLFGLLWTTQFIAGCTTVVVAGSVANFYWNRGTRGGARSNKSPLVWALATTITCHMGSVAFGSFLLALISFIRLVLEWLYRKSKTVDRKSICGLLFFCLRCCCWCFEKFVEFVNRNTLIMVGVKGKGYCSSAARATALLISNVMRVAIINTVSAFLMWLGKLLVMSTCGIVAFLICGISVYSDPKLHPDTVLSSRIVPVVASVVISYLIADVYFQVYDVVIDTVLLAFCEDCEQHDGHPKYAPSLLMKAVGESNAKSPSGEQALPWNYDSRGPATGMPGNGPSTSRNNLHRR